MATLPVRDAPELRKEEIPMFRLLAGAVFLVLAALALWFWGRATGWSEPLSDLLNWLRARGPAAAVWLILLQAVMVILVVPGPLFTMAAGFMFGTAGGSVVAVAGSTLGATGAYWIARGIARGHAHGMAGSSSRANSVPWFSRFPKLRALAEFAKRGEWTMVLSTRLIPFFPFKLSNYFFGWIRTPFAHFFWGTFIGIAPLTMVSVSVGALAADLGALLHPRATGSGRGWMWSLASLLMAAIVLVYTTRRARVEFRERVPPDAGGRP
jgi:uncharacterized membrane protein YdjX (TVP38/TMEM64 family)